MDTKLDRTVAVIKELVGIFKVERTVYLIITLISVLVLIITAVSLILRSDSQENTIAVMGLFGSSGGIVYSSGRLLKMWSEAMQLVNKVLDKNE
jgi:1,4-dihydroxy-2-naphthoate octaprenyltransferase